MPYKIDVSTFSGKIFTFYTEDDSNISNIGNVKTALSKIDFFIEEKIHPSIIRLMKKNDDGNYDEMYDQIVIKNNLRLEVIVSDHLLGVYYNVESDMLSVNPALPSERQIEAYENAIDQIDDPDYAYVQYKNGFIFMSKLDAISRFFITNENDPKSGFYIINMYNDKTWYSMYSDSSLSLSDFHERHIHLFYENVQNVQNVIIPKMVGHPTKKFENVKLEKGSNDPYEPVIFSYLSWSLETIYVVGMPNKNIKSKEESIRKAKELILTL